MTETDVAPADFDEAAYLRANPDVAEAVRKRSFASGWDHYKRFGRAEKRISMPPYAPTGLSRESDGVEPDTGLPLPPPALRKRVHGSDDLESFRNVGRVVARQVGDIMRDAGVFSNSSPNVLDFGCGCGRVLRRICGLPECRACNLYGTDLDKEAIEWCGHFLSAIATFGANDWAPPLSYRDDFFDFVYGISIFTHLPAEMEIVWLKEIRRVLKPGGYALLTVHGESALEEAPPVVKDWVNKVGFYFAHGGPGTEGLPQFYQTSFHSERFVRDHWSNYFRIEQIVKDGLAGHQDIVLCRK